MRDSLRACFEKMYKNDFNGYDMKVLNCAYYCQKFDP